jgi:tetratricopeptide (TPR) repeat protein
MSSGRPTFRVFLSSVSSEFGAARSAVASDLHARGLVVKVQENFRQEADADTTLRLLHNYIRDCDAVLCLVGSRSGDRPPPAAFAPFPDVLPAEFAEASYTQWEFFFARHFKKRLSLYIAKGYAPEQVANDRDSPELAAGFEAWLIGQGLNRTYFASRDELRAAVLRESWPELRARRIVQLPYPSLGSLFKGREPFLEQLRASLERGADGRATAVVGKALHGLGGVGKTRLAVEYAWQHQDDYHALLFVPAQTPQDLRRNLAALCGPLVLDLAEQAATEEEVRLAAALRWLHEHPGWFLILDNIDTRDAAEAAEELLARLRGGHVLLTGRLTRWSASVEPLELDVLDHGDAAAFLLERTERGRRKRPTDGAGAAELARELDGLALALEQAGAYIVQQRVSLAEYLAAWRAQVSAVQKWHDSHLMKYPRSVAVTWQTTVEQLGAAELALLRLLAWLAPDPVPQWLVVEEQAEAVWREAVALAEQASSEADTRSATTREALVVLADYSMVGWDVDGETLAVHRVVQEVLRSRLPEASRSQWLTLSLRLLNDANLGDPTDVRSWDRWDALRPHIAAAAMRGDGVGIGEPTARLMVQLGILHFGKALYREAEPLMRRALDINERSVGPDHPNVARDLNNLAQVLQATNRLVEAEPLMRRALAIDERSGGPDHPNVATDLSNLAQLLQATDRLTEAEPLLRRALAIDERGFGPDHPKVAIRLNNLAQLLQATNRLAEAEPLMQQALAIDERVGSDHPKVAIRLSNLAQLLQATNRLAEAEPLMRRALAISERSFGPDHPNVAIALNVLAQLLQATNRLAEAEPLLRRALVIDERTAGPDHPNVAIRLNNLAQLLQATNRLGVAEPLMRRALAINERSLDPGHPNVAVALNNLASLLQATNRLSEAEPLMLRHVEIFRQFHIKHGHVHPHYRAALHNYRILLEAMHLSAAEIAARLQRFATPTAESQDDTPQEDSAP